MNVRKWILTSGAWGVGVNELFLSEDWWMVLAFVELLAELSKNKNKNTIILYLIVIWVGK